jgi:hypothetical protein
MLPAAAQYQFSIFVSMRSKAAIAAIEISEAIHAYSRTVAPLSSRQKFNHIRRMTPPSFAGQW